MVSQAKWLMSTEPALCTKSGEESLTQNMDQKKWTNLPSVDQFNNGYYVDLNNVGNEISYRQSNLSLISDAPSNSYIYFVKSSAPANNLCYDLHANPHTSELQKCAYNVLPKAAINYDSMKKNGISNDLSNFSYNWIDTTPTVISVKRSIDISKTKNNTARSKSDSNTEIFKISKKHRTKIRSPIKSRRKPQCNIKSNKMHVNKKCKRVVLLKANSTSSCKDSLDTAMKNLYSFFEEILSTTLNTSCCEFKADVNDENKINKVSTASSSKNNSSAETILDSIQDDSDITKPSSMGMHWDFTKSETITSAVADIYWDDRSYAENDYIPVSLASKPFNNTESYISKTETAASEETLYTEINATSFTDLKRKIPSGKSKKNLRSFHIPNWKSFQSLQLRKNQFVNINADKEIKRMKFKPRKIRGSRKKQIMSYFKRQLREFDWRGKSGNNPQSEFFTSLRNIAFFKTRLNKEEHFFDEPYVSKSQKRKCSTTSQKLTKGKNRRVILDSVKHVRRMKK